MALNKVMLIGNAGRDPEIKTFDNGQMAVVTLATSEKYTDRNGNRKENTEWHTVVFYGKLAEVVEKYIHSGSQMYVEGKIRTRSWEKDGKTNYKTEIVAQEMQMLDRKRNDQDADTNDNPNQDLPF